MVINKLMLIFRRLSQWLPACTAGGNQDKIRTELSSSPYSPVAVATPLQKAGLHPTTRGRPTKRREAERSCQQCCLYNGGAPILQPLCHGVHAESDCKSCSGLNSGTCARQLTEYCDKVLLPLPTPSPTPTEAECPEDKSGTQLPVLC